MLTSHGLACKINALKKLKELSLETVMHNHSIIRNSDAIITNLLLEIVMPS